MALLYKLIEINDNYYLKNKNNKKTAYIVIDFF